MGLACLDRKSVLARGPKVIRAFHPFEVSCEIASPGRDLCCNLEGGGSWLPGASKTRVLLKFPAGIYAKAN